MLVKEWIVIKEHQEKTIKGLIFFLIFQMSDLSAITSRAGSALVANHGWFLFGGYKNPLIHAQKLKEVDSNWTLGPPLYKNESVSEQCLVQVRV
jgi:hypothetical protein